MQLCYYIYCNIVIFCPFISGSVLHMFSNISYNRSTITVFRERREGHKDWRIWNSQLVKYAGYEMSDGTIVGDPGGVEFTKVGRSCHSCLREQKYLGGESLS